MKKLSILQLQEENLKSLTDSLIFSLSGHLESLKVKSLESKNKTYNQLKRSNILKSYLIQVLKMTKNYDRFVKQSLYESLELYISSLNLNDGCISISKFKEVLNRLEAKHYKSFLKDNISGVKNPKDKVNVYLQYHITNIELLN